MLCSLIIKIAYNCQKKSHSFHFKIKIPKKNYFHRLSQYLFKYLHTLPLNVAECPSPLSLNLATFLFLFMQIFFFFLHFCHSLVSQFHGFVVLFIFFHFFFVVVAFYSSFFHGSIQTVSVLGGFNVMMGSNFLVYLMNPKD